MAYATKELQVKITGDTSSLDKSLSGMTKKIAVGATIANVATNILSQGINLISDSVSGAISRVDTLNNSTHTFENMGFKADVVTQSMTALNRSILGMPTSLDSAVRGVTMLAAANNDLSGSQKLYAAMNDGIIGFGGTTAMVDNAVLQLSQDLAGGRIHAQTWNSMLQSGLGPTLAAMARQMGITTVALKEGLSDGSVSVEKFQSALIEMDEKGGGGLKSLQKIAKDATSGIGTGISNAQTAITRGVAGVIKAIGSKNISDAISAFGNGFESALKKVSEAITVSIDVSKKLIDYIDKHREAIIEVSTAITVFLLPALVKIGIEASIAAAKSIGAAAVSSTAWIRSAIMTSASFYIEMAKVIVSFVTTGAKATYNAAITSAKWIASATVTSASWLIEMGKIGVAMAWTALKAAPAAADTGLAWIINAARVSFVWVTQEMPKLLISFGVTATQATVQAAITSGKWIASATATSISWVINELPKIVIGFVATSAAATIQAGITSAEWIASAAKTSAVWVVTELPKIITSFIATSGSAIAQAARASSAWIASAVTSSASYEAFAALVATPLVMPAIAVGAALVAIKQVWDAYNQMQSAIQGAEKAQANLNQIEMQDNKHFYQIATDGISSPQSKALARQYLHNTGFPGFAGGTDFAPGGTAVVGEEGPEIIQLPRGSQVTPANKTKDLLNNKSPNITLNFNVGMYAGMPVEKRQIALELYKELVRAARSQGVSLPMIGAVGVQ